MGRLKGCPKTIFLKLGFVNRALNTILYQFLFLQMKIENMIWKNDMKHHLNNSFYNEGWPFREVFIGVPFFLFFWESFYWG